MRLFLAIFQRKGKAITPTCRGFQRSESTDGGKIWFFRGDISAVSRGRWRSIAHTAGAILRYM